jgi:hypothetical protein
MVLRERGQRDGGEKGEVRDEVRGELAEGFLLGVIGREEREESECIDGREIDGRLQEKSNSHVERGFLGIKKQEKMGSFADEADEEGDVEGGRGGQGGGPYIVVGCLASGRSLGLEGH